MNTTPIHFPNVSFLFTNKQHNEFIEFKKTFMKMNQKQQNEYPESIRNNLLTWQTIMLNNLPEFISVCVQEHANCENMDKNWIHKLPAEFMDIMFNEEYRMKMYYQTISSLNLHNQELIEEIENLEIENELLKRETKLTSNKFNYLERNLKHLAEYLRTEIIEEESIHNLNSTIFSQDFDENDEEEEDDNKTFIFDDEIQEKFWKTLEEEEEQEQEQEQEQELEHEEKDDDEEETDCATSSHITDDICDDVNDIMSDISDDEIQEFWKNK
jgi:hypothetical protein